MVYNVNADTTLYSFHKQMRSDMEFPQDQLILFKALDENGGVVARYGLFDLGFGTADKVTVSDAVAKGIASFVYFYDVLNKKSVIVTYEGEVEGAKPVTVPMLVETKGPIPAEFEVYNVVRGDYPKEGERYDAYLVSGSKSDSFGTDPWIQTLKEFLMQRYQNGDKLLGVCFGHQLLALMLGGLTERSDKGWGLGLHRYQVTETKSWMTPEVSDLKMLAIHQDQQRTHLGGKFTGSGSNLVLPGSGFRQNGIVGHCALLAETILNCPQG